jgi:CRISPR-associated protein Cmr6
MRRPAYAELRPSADAPVRGHAGLWYDKYCDRWRVDEATGLPRWQLKADKEQSPKLGWIETVAPLRTSDDGRDALRHFHERQQQLYESRNALVLPMRTTSRLVAGIGLDHPVENGFLWHPTLGVPYLPGSSVKGMLNAWLRDWDDGAADGTADTTAWFRAAGGGVGALVFFDALPRDWPALQADVVTPHYGPYYREPDKHAPADWHSPTPTPFLTVAPGALFTVAVARRDGAPLGDAVRAVLQKHLCEALEWIGIGAKTAVGYGRMEWVAPPPPPPPFDPHAVVKEYLPLESTKGKHAGLIAAIERLAPAAREQTIAYLRGRKPKKKDCAPRLAALLFPDTPEGSP